MSIGTDAIHMCETHTNARTHEKGTRVPVRPPSSLWHTCMRVYHMFIYVYLYLSIYLFVSICLSIFLSVCLYIYLSIYLSTIDLSICRYIYLLSIYLSIDMFVYTFYVCPHILICTMYVLSVL